ncbi:protease HtpX [Veillonella tobetsuensis]|uniref:Protease HtpX homolog n=1 Tax=Veillonella tobetsuensis TaxID=1110546 RepID=A0A480BCX5_9FIRM|nr:zinc metalloprotease HtpX [Veillonella tobetsuensis]MBF1756346.1 zinc metalloprotease HtpX [Veillonella tobetsuensis]GCL69775.1 protease HtpX [Veillonella tobetsuensis]
MNNFKTTMLLASMIAMLVLLGNAFGGARGMMFMFILSAGMSFASYWYSDKIVLAQYNAQEVTAQSNPKLYGMVEKLAQNGKLAMPKIYIIPSDVPNAFATGRNPEHAAVAVTAGIQRLLTDDELAGVLGHELTHVKNRDTLISTIAAIIGGAISTIAQFGMFFGGRSDDRDNNANPLLLIGMVILAPLAAAIIQMSISRTREYLADEGGAMLSKNPLGLASALAKIEEYSKYGTLPNANNATAHMFIINPMMGIGASLSNLFSTHPSTQDRIARLKKLSLNPHYRF